MAAATYYVPVLLPCIRLMYMTLQLLSIVNLQLLSILRHGMSSHDLACRQAAVAKYFVSVLVAMYLARSIRNIHTGNASPAGPSASALTGRGRPACRG